MRASWARTLSRRAALQALYEWQVTGRSPAEIEAHFVGERPMKGVDLPYFRDVLHNVPAQIQALDEALSPLLDRPIGQVDPVTRAILRLGAFELRFRPDVRWRVVVNEAVELARTFGAEQSHRYVNGVLDQLARRCRPEHEAAGPD